LDLGPGTRDLFLFIPLKQSAVDENAYLRADTQFMAGTGHPLLAAVMDDVRIPLHISPSY
jgi:hypothetical protein